MALIGQHPAGHLELGQKALAATGQPVGTEADGHAQGEGGGYVGGVAVEAEVALR